MGIRRYGPTLLLYALGILIAHHPMLFSGLHGIQGAHEDPRFINYVLEHSYQWLRGNPLHREIWDPPFFYPAREVLAFSDTLFTAAPLYWPWRLAGLPADTAFQFWVMTCVSLNYFTFFVLLRRMFHLDVLPSAMGAFLFAFAAPRIVEIAHPQLQTHFYSIIALLAFLQIFDDRALPRWRRTVQWSVAVLGIVAQLYSAFYLGWYFIFALDVAVVCVCLSGGLRGLWAVIRRDYPSIAIASILGALLLSPLLAHYLPMARALGYRPFSEVYLAVPKLRSWMYMGPDSWLYGWLPRVHWFLVFGHLETAHRIGIGWITPLLCIAGLLLNRDDPVIRLLALTSLVLFIITTPIPREIILGLALVVWSLCAAALVRSRGQLRMQLTALGSIALLSWALFPPIALAYVCGIAGLAIAVAETLLRRFRDLLYPLTAVACGLFLALTTFLSRPSVLILPALAIPAMVALRRGALPSPAPLPLAALALAAVAPLFLFQGEFILWKYVYWFVPAGGAIRVSSRVSLLLLIPLSVGFARFWEWFIHRVGWRYVAASLGAFCLLEQGISTSTFDKREARARIRTVASWVEAQGKPRAFFYSSHRPGRPDWNDHVDAMYAELATGVPTVNGYSSSGPWAWGSLGEAAIRGESDEERVRENLSRWLRATGTPPDEVAWVHDGRRLPVVPTRGPDRPSGP
jgi:hypothetical protein